VTLGVVIPCYRQERFLPRTVAALERALAARDWRGVLVLAAPASAPLPPLGERWQVIAPPVARPLTPGAARMLGFGACGGEWVLFVDADVEVEADWVAAALAAAARDPAPAGIGGRLEEWFTGEAGERPGMPDMYRVGRGERSVDYLATLALYRRDALAAAGGYDPRLNNEEDFELGLRFGRLGLGLVSLGRLAGRHWSAPRPSFGELTRRWRTGLCFGQGQVLRLYLGRPGFGRLLARQALYLATLGLWGLGIAAAAAAAWSSDPRPLASWVLLPLALLALMAARKRSFRLALHSLLTWSLLGVGLVVGLFRVPSGAPARPGPGAATC
jgi:glycosyltransferase involved in cell wall biosynthesis